MDDFAIKVENVSKSFKIFHEKRNTVYEAIIGFVKRKQHYENLSVLKDISFEVKKGEVFGIIGKNGMGKTTLLRILSNIYIPDSGKILMNGKIIPFLGLGAGFQPEMSARDNVILYFKILGIPKNQLESNVKEVMKFAELEKFEDTQLKNFSSGMYARLAFSTAIRVNPDIILMDEILSVGDKDFQKKCQETFISFKKRGKTIVLISHDMKAIKENCERVMLLDKGEILMIGEAEKVITKYNETIF